MDEYTLRNATIFEADPLTVLLSLPEYNLVPSDDQQPDQEADQMTDTGGDPQNVDHPVVEDHFPWGGPSGIDLEYGNDIGRSTSTYEEHPEVSPFVPGSSLVSNDGLIHIGCMSDLTRLGYRDPIFTDIVHDINMEGWAAGFDDMFKFLKLGERFPWPTAEAFEDFWWESDIRAMVKDASDILARAPTPPDGFYDSDVAGTPWVATPEHLAASVAGMQNWVRDEDTEYDWGRRRLQGLL